MQREIKIGIFAVIAIAIAVFGYKFLQGKDVFANNNLFYVEYDNVQQLQNSAPVLVNGLPVGTVKDVYLNPDNYKKIIVEIEVRKEIQIPKNAVAAIISTSIMGGKAVDLMFANFCTGDDCAKSGDHLTGVSKGLLDSMVGVDQVETYTDALGKGVSKMLDSISQKLKEKDGEVGESLDDFQATLKNLRATTANLNQMIALSKSDIVGTMENFEAISANLKNSNEQISSILKNTSDFTGKLQDVDVKGTTEEANLAIAQLKSTLASAEKALADITQLTSKMKQGEGTLGMLMQDKALYENLNSTSNNLNLLLQDIRINPKRYTRFLSKKQIPYETPENDPAEN